MQLLVVALLPLAFASPLSLHERALAAARDAAHPRTVAAAQRAYSPRAAQIEERVNAIVANMTTLAKAKAIDQYRGEVEFLSQSTRELNYTALDLIFGGDAIGVVHDLYAPQHAGTSSTSISNALQAYVAANTSSKIPLLFAEECLHGVQQSGKTVFPSPVASAASFDKALLFEIGATIAREARAYGIVQCFAPVIGTAREYRWGRVVETFGSDIHLTSSLALMIVLGMQGGDAAGASLSHDDAILAEPKHYVAHSSPQAGVNAAPVHVGPRELLTDYAPAFEYAVRYGGARGIMAAYHELDGIPSCANEYTLSTLLRGEYGFRGWVLADDGAVRMMEDVHGTAASPADAIVQFLTAGGNTQYYDYSHEQWNAAIVESVANGTLPMSVLDARVADVLRVKLELGLFDHPTIDPALIPQRVDTPASRLLALRAAREAIVLLQNNGVAAIDAEGSTASAGAAEAPLPPLPLDLGGRHKRIAVIGPSADTIRDGDYSGAGHAENFVTILEGILDAASHAAGGVEVSFAPGCLISPNDASPIRHRYLRTPSGEMGLRGAYFVGNDTDAAPRFTRNDWDINDAWYAYGPMAFINTPFTGERIDTSFFSAIWTGSILPPLTLPNATLSIDARGDPFRLTLDGVLVLDTFPSGSGPTSVTLSLIAEKAITLELVYSRVNPSSNAGITLQWLFVGDEDAAIADAVAVAAASDIIIWVGGENDATVGEGIDSDTLELPGRQMDLITALARTGVPLVAVLVHGRPLAVPALASAASSVLSAGFAGQAQGTAVADVLTGAVNPASRTPFTWPNSVGDLPVYYNAHPSARTGCYAVSQAGAGCHPRTFAFGRGLSFTSFAYSPITLSATTISPAESVVVSVTVTNTGTRAGEEVVQLYVRDVVSSVVTPTLQLKGFERTPALDPGASWMVTFTLIPERDLYIVSRGNTPLTRVIEPGAFVVWVARASDDLVTNATFVVQGGGEVPVRMGAWGSVEGTLL